MPYDDHRLRMIPGQCLQSVHWYSFRVIPCINIPATAHDPAHNQGQLCVYFGYFCWDRCRHVQQSGAICRSPYHSSVRLFSQQIFHQFIVCSFHCGPYVRGKWRHYMWRSSLMGCLQIPLLQTAMSGLSSGTQKQALYTQGWLSKDSHTVPRQQECLATCQTSQWEACCSEAWERAAWQPAIHAPEFSRK